MEMKVLGKLLKAGNTGRANGEAARARAAARLIEVSGMGAEDVLEQFITGIRGLLESEAEKRLAEHGSNTIARQKKKGFLRQLVGRLLNPLNLLLIVLSVTSFVTGDLDGGIIIAFMVVLSVVLTV